MVNGSICLLVIFFVLVIPKIFYIDPKASIIKDFFRSSLLEYLGSNGMKFLKKSLIGGKKFLLLFFLIISEIFAIFFCLLFYFTVSESFFMQYTVFYFCISFLFIFLMFLFYYLVYKKIKKFDIPLKINKIHLKQKLLEMENYLILPNQINNLSLSEIQKIVFIKDKINFNNEFFDSAFSENIEKGLYNNKNCNEFMKTYFFDVLKKTKDVVNPIDYLGDFLPKLVGILVLSKKDKNEFYAINQVTQNKIYFDEYYNLWKNIFDQALINGSNSK